MLVKSIVMLQWQDITWRKTWRCGTWCGFTYHYFTEPRRKDVIDIQQVQNTNPEGSFPLSSQLFNTDQIIRAQKLDGQFKTS